MTDQRPYLNAGAGNIILPGPRPAHHGGVDEAIYWYPLWYNVDRNLRPGIDETVDLFRYPWPWADNSFDGALLSHLVEHIPHEVRMHPPRKMDDARYRALQNCQDGWYAFMAELWRVLRPNAIAHILAPYAWSFGAVTDPSHTRLITEYTFTHALTPQTEGEGVPFTYETASVNLQLVEVPRYGFYPFWAKFQDTPEFLRFALQTQLNVAHEIYAKLEAVK